MNKMLIALLAVAIISISALFVAFLGSMNKKVCYIDNTSLMKEFKMTKDMESKYQGVNNKRQEIIDSIKLEVSVLERKIKAGEKDLLDQYKNKVIDFQAVYEKFQADNEEINASFNQQVVKQLNQYIKEFGQDKGIDYILGANGTGSLLYASEAFDITNDVIKYVNLKYTGKK